MTDIADILDRAGMSGRSLVQRLRGHGCHTLGFNEYGGIWRACTEAASLIEELCGAVEDMIRLADMGLEASLQEPEENGNYAAYNRAVAALAKAREQGK